MDPGAGMRVEFLTKEHIMSMLTGRVAGKLVKVEDKAHWKNAELMSCIIVGGPEVRFDAFESVAFMNCVFLYDGMEVDGREWLSFMSMERISSSMRASRRRN